MDKDPHLVDVVELRISRWFNPLIQISASDNDECQMFYAPHDHHGVIYISWIFCNFNLFIIFLSSDQYTLMRHEIN